MLSLVGVADTNHTTTEDCSKVSAISEKDMGQADYRTQKSNLMCVCVLGGEGRLFGGSDL